MSSHSPFSSTGGNGADVRRKKAGVANCSLDTDRSPVGVLPRMLLEGELARFLLNGVDVVLVVVVVVARTPRKLSRRLRLRPDDGVRSRLRCRGMLGVMNSLSSFSSFLLSSFSRSSAWRRLLGVAVNPDARGLVSSVDLDGVYEIRSKRPRTRPSF